MVEIVKSVCQMCGTTYAGCGIDVHVEDDKVVKIEGTRGHAVSDGRLCAKGLAAVQLEYSSSRLQYPIKRVGERGSGQWQRISWEEAFATIVTKFKEIIVNDGVHAIGWLKGQGPGWESNWDWCQRFMNAIGSPNLATHSHNCHVARRVAHVYTYGWETHWDYENTKCMVLWGYDPVNTSMSSIAPRVIRAKQRGAKLIVINSKFSKIGAKADIYIQPRPCTDGALALAILNVIINENLYDREFVDKWTYGFDKLAELVKQYPPEKVEEITWVPADKIREVARTYATIKPALIHEGNGIDQQPNVVQNTRALAILRTITGNLDVPGGNVLNPEAPPFSRTADMTLRKNSDADIRRAFQQSVSKNPLYFRLHYCTVPELVDAIITDEPYPIKATIVHGMNPAIISSNTTRVREALKKLPFLVVFDIFPTATAELADIVLPAATFLERTVLVARQKPRVDVACYQLAHKAVEPLGECKSDYDFISELVRRLGYADAFPWKGVEEAISYQLKPIGLSYQKLDEHPEPVFQFQYSPQELYRKYEKFFALPWLPHKAALYSDAFEEAGYDPLPTYKEPGESLISNPGLAKQYPLVCMAGIKPGLYTHTQFHQLPWLREIMPDPWVEMHPQKAKELGIEDGDLVVVESLRGSIELKCKVTNSVHPGLVAVTHGWGDSYSGVQPVTNILTPSDIRCPISGATSNKCFMVKVTKKI